MLRLIFINMSKNLEQSTFTFDILFIGVRSVGKDGKEIMYDLGEKINLAVFPGLQGGPHNTAIAGIAVAMGLAKTEEFKHYQRETVKNAQVLGEELQKLGYKIVTGGTDNHIILCDLTAKKLSGSKAERILELVGISVNKNTGKHKFP